jgi:predicted amidohydrolase
VVLSEGITVVGTGKPMAAVAEPAEGPTLAAIGAQARAHRCYVVVGIYERDGDLLYNTGLLIGRDGRLAGKYRKVHLPEGEMDQGFTPGLEHPVFETDLGRVGLQICYDHAFVESARLLALHGAEVIACPIWGDPRAHGHAWEATARARALDNGVYFVGAIYGPPRGLIVDPHGDIIADAKGREGVYLADADLTAGVYRVEYHAGSYVWRYFKHVFRKERMPDTYADIVGW